MEKPLAHVAAPRRRRPVSVDSAKVTRPTALPFVMVATAIVRDETLSAQARHLYTVLATYADVSTREATLYRATLATVIGRSVDTLDRLLRELTDAGIVSVLTRRKDNGLHTASVYSLHDAALIAARAATDGRVEMAAPVRLPREVSPDTPQVGMAASVRLPPADDPVSPGLGGRTDAATWPHPCGDMAAPVRHITRTKELEPLNEREEPPAAAASGGDSPTPAKPRKTKRAGAELNAGRPDVDRLCALMVELVVANGSKKPPITETWRTECRLMLDADHRPADKAEALMRWAAGHHFWKANIRSVPKFREQYDTVRLQALADWQKTRPAGPRVASGNDDHWHSGGGFGLPA